MAGPVDALPGEWVTLASRLAADAGFAMRPDICLINWYGADGRMGMHQDKDESRASIEAGVPVVSVSLGDTARFLFGGLRRREPVESFLSSLETRSCSAGRPASATTA